MTAIRVPSLKTLSLIACALNEEPSWQRIVNQLECPKELSTEMISIWKGWSEYENVEDRLVIQLRPGALLSCAAKVNSMELMGIAFLYFPYFFPDFQHMESIPIEGKFGLGESFSLAAEKGHEEVVSTLLKALEKAGRLSEYFLIAFWKAIHNGHAHIISLLLNQPERALLVSVDGELGLGYALLTCTQKGEAECVFELIKHMKRAPFASQSWYLSYILGEAMETGRDKMVLFLLNLNEISHCFSFEKCERLRDGLVNASYKNDAGVFAAILNSEYAKNLPQDPLFLQLLRHAFFCAAGKGHEEIIEEFIKTEARFLDPESVGAALVQAIEESQISTMRMILDSALAGMIPADGDTGMGAALIKIIEKDLQDRALNTILCYMKKLRAIPNEQGAYGIGAALSMAVTKYDKQYGSDDEDEFGIDKKNDSGHAEYDATSVSALLSPEWVCRISLDGSHGLLAAYERAKNRNQNGIADQIENAIEKR